MEKSLEELLDAVSVHDAPPWSDMTEWLGVSTDADGGIIAYFAKPEHAYAFRLFLINAMLNPLVRGTESDDKD